MNEGLLSRIGRIISASANSLVDAVENAAPEMVMEEAIREVDGAVEEVRQELGKVEVAKHLASKQLNRDNAEHSELLDRINIALREGRDDLAEVAVARQMDIEAQLPVLEKAIDGHRERIKELNSYLDALQAKKREMKAALAEYREAARSQNLAAGTGPERTATNRVDRAASTFDRVMENAGGTSRSGMPRDAARLAELEELARKNRIQERLAELKASRQEK